MQDEVVKDIGDRVTVLWVSKTEIEIKRSGSPPAQFMKTDTAIAPKEIPHAKDD